MSSRWLVLLFAVALTSAVRADGPADNVPDKVRPVPPKGVRWRTPIARAPRASTSWARRSTPCGTRSQGEAALLELLPDVQIYHNAVRYALDHNEFFNAQRDPGREETARAGPGAGRAVARGQGAVEHGDRPGRARLRLEDRRLGAAVRPGRAGVVPAGHAASVPARRLVPRPRREAERAELHQRPADVAAASSRRRTRSSCIPTAATATPTSSPARSTCSRRSTTSRSIIRSTRTAW